MTPGAKDFFKKEKADDGWKDGKPICFKCFKVGHMVKDCHMKTKGSRTKDGEQCASAKVNKIEEMENE